VKHKLGEMAILIYVAEAMVYRTAGMIDRNLAGVAQAAEAVPRIEEYDVECSMIKVWCSEMLDYAVDETVQVFGGAGYVEDYPAERYWRDARVNRIFEGTNEINRLLVPGRLVRRGTQDAGGLRCSTRRWCSSATWARRPRRPRPRTASSGPSRGCSRAPRRPPSCAWAWPHSASVPI